MNAPALQTLRLSVLLSIPAELRLQHSDVFLAHVHVAMPHIGEPEKQLKLARREAIRLAQATAADEYGITINEAGRFGGLYVFNGHHQDIGG